MMYRQFTTVAVPVILIAALIGCSESGSPGPTGPGTQTDRTPPAPVADARLTWSAAGGNATLTWTAPSDNTGDTVDRYEIRYSYSLPLDWEVSRAVSDPPQPATPGSEQEYRFASPDRGRDLYAAIRSFDGTGNASPASATAHVHITGYTLAGTCYEPVSGLPVEGLAVTVTASRVHKLLTDALGQYTVQDAGGETAHISIRSGASGSIYHGYDLTLALTGDVDLEHPIVEYIAADNPLGQNILKLCVQAAYGTSRDRHLKKWSAYPVDVYIPELVNGSGIDYGDFGKRAVEQWNSKSGLNIFNLVTAPPENGIEVFFVPRAEIEPHNGLADIETDVDGFPTSASIYIIDELGESKLWSILLHELGHTIHMGHLPSGYLMYAGQPLPDDITDDEVRMVQLFMALPNNLHLEIYDTSVPAAVSTGP